MRLPDQMKSETIVFVAACVMIFFGTVFLGFALHRVAAPHKADWGILASIGFIVWEVWVLLSYKGKNDAR